MEIFSEVYGSYYKAVRKLIEKCQEETVNKKQAEYIINQFSFSETSLTIIPKLMRKEWNFFNIEEDVFKSRILNKPFTPLSDLQLSWLYSMVIDIRSNLFLTDSEKMGLISLFEKRNIKPLYLESDFHYFDKSLDGDDYRDPNYITNFKKILNAIKNKESIYIRFKTRSNRIVSGLFLPFKMEYSKKDEKFRVHLMTFKNGRKKNTYKVNISRIITTTIVDFNQSQNIDYEKYIDSSKNKEPIVIEISKERNALERCMLQFARYEKKTEYDNAKDKYICYIYYSKDDESELLIQILSFGPTILVLGHKDFLRKVKERVSNQVDLFLQIQT